MSRWLSLALVLMACGCRLTDRTAAGWRRFALPWLTSGDVVAWNLRTPSAVLVHGQWAYFTEIGKRRSVQRVPIGGGRHEMIAACGGSPFWLAADDTRLYWTEFENGSVRSFEFESGALRVHATDRPEPNMIVAHRNRVWWVENSGDTIQTLDPQTGVISTVFARQETPDRLATDGRWLAWTLLTLDETGPLMAAPAAGGVPRPIARVVNQVDLAVADGVVFCLEGRTGLLWSIPAAGGSRTILCDSVGSVGNVTVHGEFVYWSEEFADALYRVPRAGGRVERLTSAVHPEVLWIDRTHVYWAEPTTHTIRRARLPESAGAH